MTQEWKQALDNIAYMERRLAALLAQIEGPLPEDGWKKPKEPKGGAEKEKNGKDVTPRLRPEPASSWFTGATLVTEGDGASDAGITNRPRECAGYASSGDNSWCGQTASFFVFYSC